MLDNSPTDLYESILETSERGELWCIKNSDPKPLEIHLILSSSSIKDKPRYDSTFRKVITKGIDNCKAINSCNISFLQTQ